MEVLKQAQIFSRDGAAWSRKELYNVFLTDLFNRFSFTSLSSVCNTINSYKISVIADKTKKSCECMLCIFNVNASHNGLTGHAKT